MGFDTEVVHQKRINVGCGVERFTSIAGSMAGLGIDADQNRIAVARFFLHGGCVLEGMGWPRSIGRVRGGNGWGGKGHAGTKIVKRRVSVKNLELSRIVARAIVRNPVPSDRE